MITPSLKSKRRFLLAGIFLAGLSLATTPVIAKTYTIWVDGLACPFCSYGIEKQLSKLPGVATVKTSIKSGTVTLNTKGSQKLTETAMRAAVDRAGFTVRKIK